MPSSAHPEEFRAWTAVLPGPEQTAATADLAGDATRVSTSADASRAREANQDGPVSRVMETDHRRMGLQPASLEHERQVFESTLTHHHTLPAVGPNHDPHARGSSAGLGSRLFRSTSAEVDRA